MSISAAAKARRASERFMLVRLAPARYMNDDLASVSGRYEATLNRTIFRVERNGTALTQDTSANPSTNDHWYHNPTTGLLQVKLAGAPSSSNVIVVYYYLFYTGHRTRKTYETPTDSATTLRDWEPKILNYPTLKQSFKNILAGVFTIEPSSLEIANADNSFENYLGPNDSFNEKDLDIWLCVDSTDEIQRIYQGKINAVRLSRGKAVLSFYDSFSRLGQSALMGDSSGEAYFSRRTGSFPDMDPNFQFKPVPVILGKFSPYKLINEPALYDGLRLDPITCYQGVCTSYDTNLQTYNNRTWGLCRIPSAGLRTPVFPAVYSEFSSGPLTTLSFTQSDWDASSTDVEIGDLVRLSEGATTLYGRVIRIVENVATSPVTAEVYFLTHATVTPAFTSSVTILPYDAPALVIRSGVDDYYPLYTRDFTYSLTTTTGGNKYLSITFVNNFESHHSGLGTLDPAKHSLYFRARVATSPLNHADVLQDLCESAGMTCDATTFAAAKAALDVRTFFTIPMLGETEYGTYRDYVEEILKSTLGYVRLGADQEVEYKLLSAPSSSSSVDDNLILRRSLTAEVDYNDIYSEIVASNPHNDSKTTIDDASASAVETATSTKARYLHGVIKSNRFIHCLESITSRITALMAIKAARRVTYTFDTATEHLDTLLGDDLQLDADEVLGGGGTVDVKVVGIDKNCTKVGLEASDLKDL